MYPGGMESSERLLALSNLAFEAQILDAGCCTCSPLDYLPKAGFANITGIDCSGLPLQIGSKMHSISLSQAFFTSLPFYNYQMDAILTECCLSVGLNTKGALTEFERVLHPSDCLALSGIYAHSSESLPKFYPITSCSSMHGTITQKEHLVCLQKAGFEILV
jgi:ubiquinone/menaquinone biosynthesis C-methylase UbiE